MKRKTNETDISIDLDIDGQGDYEIQTGIGFMDNMLCIFARHGMLDLKIYADGDLYIDSHHTVEDVGIVLGQVISKAIGDKNSIKRYGNSFIPIDETLAQVSIDISGRPYMHFEAELEAQRLGNFETEMVEEFFKAVAYNSGMTIHARVLYGKNTHHKIEALFKGFGRAFREAVEVDTRIKG